MHEFKHPKYYTELRKRNKLAESRQPVVGGQQQSDQAISDEASTEATSVRPDPGPKPQAASDKHQAPSLEKNKPQASSPKQQASSSKPQASSSKI
jgi:hypothetical protein